MKLMEGQKVIGIDGKTYLIEKGDVVINLKEESAGKFVGTGYVSEKEDMLLYFNAEYDAQVFDIKGRPSYFNLKHKATDEELEAFGLY